MNWKNVIIKGKVPPPKWIVARNSCPKEGARKRPNKETNECLVREVSFLVLGIRSWHRLCCRLQAMAYMVQDLTLALDGEPVTSVCYPCRVTKRERRCEQTNKAGASLKQQLKAPHRHVDMPLCCLHTVTLFLVPSQKNMHVRENRRPNLVTFITSRNDGIRSAHMIPKGDTIQPHMLFLAGMHALHFLRQHVWQSWHASWVAERVPTEKVGEKRSALVGHLIPRCHVVLPKYVTMQKSTFQ